MNTLNAQTALLLADQNYGHWGPGWGVGPWFVLIPITFWLIVIAAVVLLGRRRRGRHGESTLRDAYARGEVTEAEYRARLAVLRETRR
ncbi:SHOCT domain-containing protein [Rhodococcus sp. Q]|uniref:SHOCT domain-containing protein n=1 Tax=Rhodococcus sp. Q TaxID=2502252 RepID=UPI0010F9D8A8|nr:SHOCT domain-containing protein [Rhodococcus sp. Q]